MKKKLVKIALTLLCVLTFSLAVGGCSNGSGGKKYDYLVTFDYNVGNIQNSEVPSKYLGVKENSLVVMQPGVDADFKGETVQGYFVEGWYLPQTDSEGNVVIDETDNRVLLDTKWNFESDRVTKNITLYANLMRNRTLTVKGGDSDLTFDNSIYGTTVERPVALVPSKMGYTFFDYYVDEDCTEIFEWPYTFEEQEKTIYAKFLEGTWTLVSTAEEFNTAISLNTNPICLKEDLDFTGMTWVQNRPFEYEIDGYGHSISNITCEVIGNRNNPEQYALFGYIGGANIHDITFANLKLSFHATMIANNPGGFTVAPFATYISEDTVLSNVTLTGTLTVSHTDPTYVIVLSKLCSNEADFDDELLQGVNVTGLTVVDERLD